MKKYLLIIFYAAIVIANVFAQSDSVTFTQNQKDTIALKLNLDGIYNRPFLQTGKFPVSIGGYLEANSSYFATDGISEGLSFQFRRLTLFFSSTLTERIKFISEIEFEDGTKEINIEFAAVDVAFHPLLNLRGGIVINPIGGFNQNHDGPKWEFIDRPISSTTIIPSTFSNAGFGLFGKYARSNFVWSYEAYLTNGLDDKIIANDENRTSLPAGKHNPERFEESFNGVPLITAKTSFRQRAIGEIGLSWMRGVYNKFEDDGLVFDKKRRVDLFAIDINTMIPEINTLLNGEWVWAFIDVPSTYTQQFGNKQQGGFLDIVQPIYQDEIFGWKNSVVNLALRLEYIDYNIGRFKETGGDIADEIFAIVPGISFRPTQQTVFRANYRYHSQSDILGNPPALTGGFQFGFSTYF